MFMQNVARPYYYYIATVYLHQFCIHTIILTGTNRVYHILPRITNFRFKNLLSKIVIQCNKINHKGKLCDITKNNIGN